MSSLWKRIKSGIAEVLKSRLFVAVIVFCIMSAVLIQRVFYLQIVKGQEYVENYKLQIPRRRMWRAQEEIYTIETESFWLITNWRIL